MEDFIPTRASRIKENYISVHYNASNKKSVSTDSLANKQKLTKNDPANSIKETNPAELKKEQEKEMKKARYDVIKFGMSGFEKKKAKKTKVELAISLGAIPPKNKRMNYKKLKMHRKMDDEKMRKNEYTSGFTSSLLKPKVKKIYKKDSGILGAYGKVSKSASQKQKS